MQKQNSPGPAVMARFEEIVAAHPAEIVGLVNPDATIVRVSPAEGIIFGLEPGKAVGLPFEAIIAPDDLEHVKLGMQDALLNEESVNIRLKIRRLNGQLVAVRGLATSVICPDTEAVYLIVRLRVDN